VETERYQPTAARRGRAGLFQEPGYEWPGDTEGRTLLAWVLLKRMTGREPRYLDTALQLFDDFTNSDGYFGSLLDHALLDEQQLAGHGWVLRALCEHFDDTADERSLARITAIVESLALPTAGFHARYPIDPNDRNRSLGGIVGEPAETLDSWRVSSDIGCDFIFLDGLAQAATLLNSSATDELVDEIIARFLEVDVESIEAQTHATLTGVRALLRWHRHTGRPELLAAADERFRRYTSHAMSGNYANWNWFGRPSHTEPCAIVDSFLIACELWQITGDSDRLADAHRIYYNAICHAQRNHGGFGCDSVVGADESDPDGLRVVLDEAWWCCTMRGAEGLATAGAMSAVARMGELAFPLFFSTDVEHETAGGTHVWRSETEYPSVGRLVLTYDGGPVEPVTLAVWTPPWAEDVRLIVQGVPSDATPDDDGFVRCTLQPQPGDIVEFEFEMRVLRSPHPIEPAASRRWCVMRGPLLFGTEHPDHVVSAEAPLEWVGTAGVVREARNGAILRPLNDMIDRSDYLDYRRQILIPFAEETSALELGTEG
jgi:hypothetical protein